jgi:hypothetical protein
LQAAGAYLLVIATTLLAVAICVLLQYEYLILLWRRLSVHPGHRRIKVLYAIFAVLVMHVLEIGIFALALWLLTAWPAVGRLGGEEAGGFFDYLYFSAVTFTTVGFGELWPIGAIRFLCAVQALTGFVLIAWSAAFTFLEMERFWRTDDMK